MFRSTSGYKKKRYKDPRTQKEKDDDLFHAIDIPEDEKIDIEQVESLLIAGANPTRSIPISLFKHTSAYDLARQRADADLMTLLGNGRKIRTEERGDLNNTLIMDAVIAMNETLNEASPDQREAIKIDHLSVIAKLLSNGARMDAQNAYGDTALHIAAITGNSEAVSLLLEHIKLKKPQEKKPSRLFSGKDPLHLCNKKGLTPYEGASLHQHTEIAALIQQYLPVQKKTNLKDKIQSVRRGYEKC